MKLLNIVRPKELLLILSVFFLVMFPYIWKGQDVKVNVWDNLDSNLVWYKMLKSALNLHAIKIFLGIILLGKLGRRPKI